LVKYDESDCNDESADAGISVPNSLRTASSGSAKTLACAVGAKEFLRHLTFSSRGAFALLHRSLLATAGGTTALNSFWNSVSDMWKRAHQLRARARESLILHALSFHLRALWSKFRPQAREYACEIN
jgi:hypothetical protein